MPRTPVIVTPKAMRPQGAVVGKQDAPWVVLVRWLNSIRATTHGRAGQRHSHHSPVRGRESVYRLARRSGLTRFGFVGHSSFAGLKNFSAVRVSVEST